MKRFTRLLLCIVTLALLVIAFAVVALAEESRSSLTTSHLNYESYKEKEPNENGDIVITDSASKKGKWTAHFADNGNTYMLGEYTTNVSGNENYDFYFTDHSKYKMVNYPYFAIDFDFMTPDSLMSGIDFYLYVRNYKTALLNLKKFYITDFAPTSEAYEWEHLTLIVDTTELGVFKLHFFNNGKLVKTATQDFTTSSAWTGLNGVYKNLNFYELRMYPGANTTQSAAFDNFSCSYFTEGYTLEEMATNVFNSEYELPYGKTVAKIGDTVYDSLQKAIDAAEAGDKITLTDNIKDAVCIDKAISIDRNVYSEDGTASGEYYTYDYYSTKAFIATEDNGIADYAVSESKVTVKWDSCDGECDCYFKDKVGHILTAETEVALGNIPEFFNETPVFETVDGLEIIFKGWTDVKGGKEPIEIGAVTEEQVKAGELRLYPVYEITQYTYEVVSASGAHSYYTEDSWTDALSAAAKGKIILHTDADITKTYTLTSSLEIDLNGFELRKSDLVLSQYNAVSDENGGWTQGTQIGTTTGSASPIFTIEYKTSNSVFTFTSSKPGAAVYNAAVKRVELLDADGNLVNYTNTLLGSGGNFVNWNYAPNSTININGDITFYCKQLVDNVHSSNLNTVTLNIDGITAYSLIDSGTNNNNAIIYITTGGTVNVKNSKLIVLTGDYPFRTYAAKSNSKLNARFENCLIVGTMINDKSYKDIEFINCRITSSISQSDTAYYGLNLGMGTMTVPNLLTATKTPSHVMDGCIQTSVSKTETYSLIAEKTFAITESGAPVFNFTTAEKSYTFKYEIVDFYEIYAPVVWKDALGKTLAKTDVKRGTLASAPECYAPIGDGWRSAPVSEWLDESGSAADFTIGDAESYVFVAKTPVTDESTVYEAYIAGAQFNFIYYGQFNTVLYLPVTEGMAAPTVSGFTYNEQTVKINGYEYHAYTRNNTTAGVAEDYTATVSYTIDGVDYSQDLTLSALLYARLVLSAPISEVESVAVANMVRYIKEARAAAGIVEDDVMSEKFAELEKLYAVSDYKAKDEYDALDANYDGLSGISICFSVSESSAAYVIALPEETFGTADNAVVTVKYANGDTITLIKSETVANTWYTADMRVYDLVSTLIEISVTIPETETALSGTYSLGAYINAMDNSLAKAMYEFGTAAKSYRAYLQEN